MTHIAADADVDPGRGAEPYFRLIVETDKDHLLSGGQRLAISPGMSAQVDLVLGRRSVLRYLVDPVLRLREEAFKDR